ncbi:MAG: RQC domain protein [Alicyclobacillus macrosporangiidus]|uniref:RQC domain-containing protein n=1 Tax=Alicyclobacillus macrosporangiidus TaxID=392015 RepID=UPI0026EC06FA|nr:RQC-minor-1 family DNA-binding protein [Alicyclobacillus macrosporangiidus]MCL6599270.1 RQC domain protein [Alicyclobacillus macrosporangiidus]
MLKVTLGVEVAAVPRRKALPEHEILLILRAADDIIAQGGRTMLAKILKGSKDKRLLEHELDRCPAYGCFSSLTLDEIMQKIDWMIHHGYLKTEYFGKLPLIVFTDKGWMIEREQRAEEFLREWDFWLDNGIPGVSMEYLKDRNRGMITLFLEKVKQTGNPKYIPLLRQWEQIDYKKVRAMIRDVIKHLESSKMGRG